MNSKKLLTFIALPFMLAGCADHPSITTKQALEHIKTFPDMRDAGLDFEYEGEYYFNKQHVGGNSEEKCIGGDVLVYNPVEGVDLDFQEYDDVSKSYFLEMPLLLYSKNFYRLTNGKLDLNDCIWGILQNKLIYSAGTTSQIYITKTADGGIKFESFNSFVDFAVYSLEVDSIRARINGYVIYNPDGLLEEEYIASVSFDKNKAKDDPSMFMFHATYSYA